jgi:hypothetical protein
MRIVNEQGSSLIRKMRHGFMLFRFCDVEVPVIPVFIRGVISVIGLGRDWGNWVTSEEHLTSPVYNRTNDLYSGSLDFLSRSFDACAL